MRDHTSVTLADAMILATCGLCRTVCSLIRDAGGVGDNSWSHLLWLREEADRMLIQASGRVPRPNQHPTPGVANDAPERDPGTGPYTPP